MGVSASSLLAEEIMEYRQQTGFSAKQIKRLYERFVRLDKAHTGRISAEDFMFIPELAMNPLVERIIKVFDSSADADEVHVTFPDFLRTLAVFLPPQSFPPDLTAAEEEAFAARKRQEKLDFVFKIYDINGDGRIDTEELLQVLKMMVTENITDEQLRFIAETTIREASGSEECDFITKEQFAQVLRHSNVDARMTIRF
eukprot:m.65772 g.65772  ORF g.65772 m.65772 type:complete len:199 (+) comp7588_c0_seq1:1268-1864(+)